MVRYFDPRRVILFGSQARHEAQGDSDHDLLVVLDDDAPPEKLSWRAFYEARRDYHPAVDILACTRSDFERRSRIGGSLLHTIAREGRIV